MVFIHNIQVLDVDEQNKNRTKKSTMIMCTLLIQCVLPTHSHIHRHFFYHTILFLIPLPLRCVSVLCSQFELFSKLVVIFIYIYFMCAFFFYVGFFNLISWRLVVDVGLVRFCCCCRHAAAFGLLWALGRWKSQSMKKKLCVCIRVVCHQKKAKLGCYKCV